jgi:hypothetical protein
MSAMIESAALSEDLPVNNLMSLNNEERYEILDFIAKESEKNFTSNIKVNEGYLIKIFSYLVTGKVHWTNRTFYSVAELDKVLNIYSNSSIFIQLKLEPLLEVFKKELYGDIE